jgi:hypothetical protein
MKAEYDFSKGERGKFYSAAALFRFPVYLEPDVNAFMSRLAEEKDLNIEDLVNDWLRANISVLESVSEREVKKRKPQIAE